MFVVRRSSRNPILTPIKEHPWEAFAVFNWSPIKVGGKIHALYRAMSLPQQLQGQDLNISSIGHTTSIDGIHFEARCEFISPQNEWDKIGCEDPRMTEFEGKFYIFYTAISEYPFRPTGIRVALAVSTDLENIESRHLITPFNAKAMVLFPERIKGKMTAALTANTDLPPSKIAIVQFDKDEDLYSPSFWDAWYYEIDKHTIEPRRLPTDHVEIGAPPIKTPYGWLMLYSHIQNYHTNNKLFGVEALLLDLEEPTKILGRTKGAMFVPEELYERYGHISNVVFPSGALVEKDELKIYYGACDMVCCMTTVNLDGLLASMRTDEQGKIAFRFSGNPIITPGSHDWESKATFNPAAVETGGKIYLLYRAMSEDNTSVIGYAASEDGLKIDERLDMPIFVPREPFEVKEIAGGSSGCEDPRITKIDDKLYLCYTAFNGVDPPMVAATSISVADFVNHRWNWERSYLITPKGVDEKDACILPEKINGKYMVFHRVETHVCADFLPSLDFSQEKVTKCIQIFGPRAGMWDSLKVGITGPPIKTEKGWLLLYHGVSDHNTYRVGAVLLDLDDPTVVISRLPEPILEPEESFEKEGQVPNVVFPCGVVQRDGKLFIYYGGADQVVCGAQIDLDKLLNLLDFGK